jgi:hypothetical protein
MSARAIVQLLALVSGSGTMGVAADTGGGFAFCPASGNPLQDTFADCTRAQCEPSQGKDYSCRCDIRRTYSAMAAGADACAPATSVQVQSRYHPVESYQVCSRARSDSRAWAWCLGILCSIDPSSTGADRKANCLCTPPPAGVKPLPYVIVTDAYRESLCQSSPVGLVYSSATPKDVTCITEFLQGHVKDLRPPKVLNGVAPACAGDDATRP